MTTVHPTTVGPAEFRLAMGRYPTGIAVVAAMHEGVPHGFTVNSFASVSLDPLLLSFCAGRSSSTWPAIRAAGRFDVAFRLKENHWNGTVAPQLVVRRVFDTPEAYEELRARLAELWRGGESAWTPEARRIFGELALHEDGARRRQLLESESFRALLLDPALPRAA